MTWMRQASVLTAILWTVGGAAGSIQGSRPQTSGAPSLPTTINFIQDKINNQGPVGYFEAHSWEPEHSSRVVETATVTNPSVCVLRLAVTTERNEIVTEGYNYRFSGIDLHATQIEVAELALKDVGKITVQDKQESTNRLRAQAEATLGLGDGSGHPSTIEVNPAVFEMTVTSTKGFPFQSSFARGQQTPYQFPIHAGTGVTVVFRDQDTADQVARAMLHAVELCGGTNKDLF